MKQPKHNLLVEKRRKTKMWGKIKAQHMEIPGGKRQKLPNALALEFFTLFKDDNPSGKFRFFRKFFLYLEEENSSLQNRFAIQTQEFSCIDETKTINGFNRICLTFLNKMMGIDMRRNKLLLYSMAHVYMGMAREFGAFGIEKNPGKAFHHYRTAAVYHNSFGCFRFAQCYERGIGTNIDLYKATAFYRMGAKLGCVEALHTFGAILIYGLCNINADLYGGLFYLQLAVKKTDEYYPFTYFDFATCYDKTSLKCLIPDDTYALQLFTKGAGLGCPNSQFRLGKIYEYAELGVAPDMHKAIYWYQRAAKNGHIDALLMIANFYYNGIKGFISQNKKQAYLYALKAGCKGSAEAAYKLGLYIEEGCGVEQDILHATWWYSISSALGNLEADRKLEEINRFNNGNSGQRKSWISSFW